MESPEKSRPRPNGGAFFYLSPRVSSVSVPKTLYEASRVKRFFAINIFLFLRFKRRSSALMARQAPLLGRAERSTPKTRGVAPEGARG